MTSIPVLAARGRSLAEAYENALVTLYRQGVRLPTQYDRPNDPLSVDATMNITVEDPWADPMIHKAFPGGLADLREYVYELEGIKDSWTKNVNDPHDTRWEYTYHGRLQHWGRWKEKDPHGRSRFAGAYDIDQIALVIAKLAGQPHTRQAQLITWMPNLDLDCYDPPCLQSLWYRVIEDETGVWHLNCNIRFRSNDAWGANFMNMFGFIQFNRVIIADGLAQQTGRTVRLARLNWQADSYHIYGKDLERAEAMLFRRLETLSFGERILNFHDPEIQEMYHEEEPALLAKIEAMTAQLEQPVSVPGGAGGKRAKPAATKGGRKRRGSGSA